LLFSEILVAPLIFGLSFPLDPPITVSRRRRARTLFYHLFSGNAGTYRDGTTYGAHPLQGLAAQHPRLH